MKHENIEIRTIRLVGLILLAISLGGIIEILPLFSIPTTVEPILGVRPYTPLELRGRDIYQREGCQQCHTQMIRTLETDTQRYGHYSLAAESRYDYPAQWGSRRLGPDLARLGGKYTADWHARHLTNPRAVVPHSIMPAYPWLRETPLQYADVSQRMAALHQVGVPYSDSPEQYRANVDRFGIEVANQLDILHADENLVIQADKGNYDSIPNQLTELDALIAYLQILGTFVDFTRYPTGYFAAYR